MRNLVLGLLERLRLLRPAFRSYEALRSLDLPGHDSGCAAPDGLPVPPRRLRVQVAGTADVAWFLESGRLAAETIRQTLARHGTSVEDAEAVLDFGCGCGRVLRHWRGLDGRLHGSDANVAAVEWCRRHLPAVQFHVNALRPRGPFHDDAFDVAYALSVFTHLPEDAALAWVNEFKRVLRPGGHLLLTLHGARYVDRLSDDERARFEAGELVVRWRSAAGTNLCTAFHPERYVRERLAGPLELVEFVPEGASGNPHQDVVLLRKRA